MISKAAFRFSISILISSIYRVLSFVSSSFLAWVTEMGSSTPFLWVTLLILLLTLATMRSRRQRVQGAHYLKEGSVSIPLATVNLDFFKGIYYLRRFSGIHSSSSFFYRMSRDQLEVVWRRHYCPLLVRRHMSDLSTTLLSFLQSTIESIIWELQQSSSTCECVFQLWH